MFYKVYLPGFTKPFGQISDVPVPGGEEISRDEYEAAFGTVPEPPEPEPEPVNWMANAILDNTEMLVDQDYRLMCLELGI